MEIEIIQTEWQLTNSLRSKHGCFKTKYCTVELLFMAVYFFLSLFMQATNLWKFANKHKKEPCKNQQQIAHMLLCMFFLLALACPVGSYGVGCSTTCRNCRDVDKCHFTNGTCLTGCIPGYMGDICDTREYIFN